MKLPNGWEIFYDDVCQKVKTLTATGVWSSDASTMLAWLGNFKKNEHRYIAAHILDRMTFRTEKMLEGAYRLFLASIFREYVQKRLGDSSGNIEEWLKTLRNAPYKEEDRILLCSVSKAGEHGESGSHIIRVLTGELFHEKRVFSIDTSNLSSLNDNVILIVDDFVGSGKQFVDFAEPNRIREAATRNHVIYAPAMAYEKGLENIKNKNYGIDLFPLEVVTEDEQFFSHQKGSRFCGDDINLEKEVLLCYHEMRGLDPTFTKGAWLGRDKASLCVAFQWGCPNQSLGVMWYPGSGNWNRLVRRRGAQ